MRRWLWAIVAVVVVVGTVAGVVVWSRSDGGTSQQDRFIDAYVTGLAATDLSDEGARCVAEATVDAIGIGELAAATSPEGIRANPPVAPSEVGIAVSNAQGRTYYEALRDCMDLRRRLAASMGDAGATCFNQLIDDALVGELVVAQFTSAAEASPDLEAALTDVAEQCLVAPTGGRHRQEIKPLATLRNVQTDGHSVVQMGEHTVTVITYNVRGLLRGIEDEKSIWVDSDMTRFTGLVGAEVARRRADFVLLQEVCGSQAEMIAERSNLSGHSMSVIAMGSLGPEAFRYEDARTLCPGDDPAPGTRVPYGQAILAHLPNATQIAPPGGAPALCIRAESPLEIRVCGVHTENPAAQSIPPAFAEWSRIPVPVILGGDFNTTPGDSPITDLFGSMREAEESCNGGALDRCTPTTPAGPAPFYKKIDYIFADKLHFAPLRSEVLAMHCSGLGFCSDHRMQVGTFTLDDDSFELPPQIDPSHGGPVWAVYLAVTDSFDDPRIAQAEEAARGMGYDAAASDLGCDGGAAAALGRDPSSFAAAVAVYFSSDGAAELARAAFERRDIPVVGVAKVSPICLDEGF